MWKPEFGWPIMPNEPEHSFIAWLQDNGYIVRIAIKEAWSIDLPEARTAGRSPR